MAIEPTQDAGLQPDGQRSLTVARATRLLPRGKRWLLPLVVFCLVELAALVGLFNRPEMNLYDAWFRLRGVQDPGDRVVIVAIDEASVRKIGPLPWPRSVHAQLLDRLKEARVVGFDLVFDIPTNPAEDKTLAEAVARHGRVVLASQFTFEQDTSGEMVQVFQGPLPEVTDGAAGLGFANTPTDPDGVVRRITMVDVNTFELPFPCLGLAVALAAANVDASHLELRQERLLAGGKVIPLDRLNRAFPHFWGPRGTFKTYSYAEVIGGNIPAVEFHDKIVLVGVTTSIDKDYYPTPFTTSNLILSGSLPAPGVEIHACTVQSFLEGIWYKQASPALNLLFLFIAGLVTALVVTRRGPWWGLTGMMAVVTAAAGTAYCLWYYAHLWLNLAAPLALILLNYTAITAADFVQAEMGRRRIRAMFCRYVSPAVVEELIRNPESLSLGGQRRTVTIMFCDIRGFTAYSENKDPEQVVSRLNQYLTVLTHVIFRHGGTLDKYLGDGLMAVFGAPIPYPDHAQRALQAAVEIQQEVEGLNREWAARGEPPLKIGIGINSGSVLVGNVGSPERMDYTVIGEEVNLASRVEGLTKTFHSLIVISERSVKMLKEAGAQAPELKYLGHAEVKGFTHPVGVYTVADKEMATGEPIFRR